MTIKSFIAKTVATGAMALAIAAPAKADWSGLYIGGSVGYLWSGDVNWTFDNTAVPQSSVDIENAIAAAHLGIQHQWGQIVVGLEASYTGRLGDDKGSVALCPNPAFTCAAGFNTMFTIGPRLGWAPNHQWLLYVTGGYATAQLTTNAVSAAAHEKTSATHEGWFFGGGVEFNLHRGWVLGLEYRHVELDSAHHIAFQPPAGSNRTIEADFDTVSVRLSYKFGRTEEAPLK